MMSRTSQRLDLIAAFTAAAMLAPVVAYAQPTDPVPTGDTPPADDAAAPPTGETVPPGGEPPRDVERDPVGNEAWGGASDVALPSFLDTTDRRVRDNRPPPTPEQVAALRALEAEVGRFTAAGETYRGTVVSLVRREYLRQRRGRDQWFARQIRREEQLTNEARERAIALFERFIRDYPNDPTYTPDAMFRLGELYFERSAIRYQELYDAATLASANGDEEAMDNLPTAPDFSDTIQLYQQIVRQFPTYRRIDGVYYLIGYCANEMDRPEEARDAWLALVCNNKYRYNPDDERYRPEPEAEGDAAEDTTAAEHPSLGLDTGDEVEETVPAVFVNPYAGCQPVREEARFLSETWFRIGEYHFDDYLDSFAVEKAIAAYGVILENPEDRNYSLALYKVAWAYYRANRFPEAVRHFAMLVQWSDDQMAATGRAGSDLRPEAMQYLGIAFAFADWNDNLTDDDQEGGQSGFQRLQDPNLLPQDREWTPDVYFQTGDIYFDEAKYDRAVQVWQYALERWPNHRLVPHYTERIAAAYREAANMPEYRAWLRRLGLLGPGSDWYDQNNDHPTEQREAENLAQNAAIQAALDAHDEAQTLRQQCLAAQDLELCRQAQERYGVAAEGYRVYLENYPNTQQAYELHFNLADALFWSEQYDQAATTYAEVRDSNLDDRHLHEAARMVVESIKRLMQQQEEAGTLTVRDEAPTPQGEPPSVSRVEMPQLVQRMAQAREMFLARVDERHDQQRLRPAYDYNNAILLYWYGYWPESRERLNRIYQERCSGPGGAEEGQVAWESLRNMALELGETEEVERLATDLRERRCTFGRDEDVGDLEEFCADAENAQDPLCRAGNDILSIEFRRALAAYEAAKETPEGPNRISAFENAATLLVEAADRNPDHPDTPIALLYVGLSLDEAGRPTSAQEIYQRVINEVGPRQSDDEETQAKYDSILAEAFFRRAEAAKKGFEFEDALTNYRVLVDSRRFAQSTDEGIVEFRESALVNSALLLQQLGRYSEASTYFRRVAESTNDADLQRNSRFQIAENAFNQRSFNDAVREYRGFISTYSRDPAAGELVVQSYWRLAEIKEALRQNRDYPRALEDVVRAFAASGQAPGSIAAEYAAQARFILVDEDMSRMEGYQMDLGRPSTGEALGERMRAEIARGTTLMTGLRDGYATVPPYRRPTWTIAALVRTGRLYELLARGVISASIPLPSDIQRAIRAADAYDRETMQIEFEDNIRARLDQEVRPFECKAIANYALAARAGRVGSIDNEYTREAAQRLQAYGEDRIAECIASEAANTPGLEAYQSGEFARAPAGQLQGIPADVAPPPFISEDN